MSLDGEEQDDELLALASIYEDSFVSALDHDAEADLAVKDEVLKGGELAIHLDLPPEFSVLSKRVGDNGKLDSENCLMIYYNRAIIVKKILFVYMAYV